MATVEGFTRMFNAQMADSRSFVVYSKDKAWKSIMGTQTMIIGANVSTAIN